MVTLGADPGTWGMADGHPVASAPLVSLNVVKGPEGDGESLPVIDHGPAASSVQPMCLTLRLKRIDVCCHDARQVSSLLGDCQTVL